MSTRFAIQKRPQKKAFPIPQLKIATNVLKGRSRVHVGESVWGKLAKAEI